MSVETRRQILGIGLLIAVLAWTAWEAQGFASRARIFPQVVALLALFLCMVEAIRLLLAERSEVEGEGKETPGAEDVRYALLRERFFGVVPYIASIVAYYAAIFLFGFPAASFLFVLAFLRLAGEVRWLTALGASAAVLGILLVFSRALNVLWPEGLLPGLLGIPS
jgi:hypothetical protein